MKMSDFQRKDIYYVIKKEDVDNWLEKQEKQDFLECLYLINHHRDEQGKRTDKKYVCISDSDQKKFDAAWSILDGRHDTLTAQVAELREALEELSGKIDAYYFDDKYQSYIEDLLNRTKPEGE